MTISSRTPEGLPNRCPVCGSRVIIEPSLTSNDAPCPRCGHLLWWLQRRFPDTATESLTADTQRAGLQGHSVDSLDVVELVMELEEEFDINIPDEDAAKIKTVGDAARYLKEVARRQRKGQS